MKIGAMQENRYIKVSGADLQEQPINKKNDKNNQEIRSIYAGNLNLVRDPVEITKKNGQKQAIRAILETFSKELDVDTNINEMRTKQEELRAEMSVYHDKLASVQKMKEEIRKGYEVSEYSQEEMDVNLIMKGVNNPEALTDEEKQQLEAIGSLTDFQKEILECNKIETYWNNNLNNANRSINSISIAVNSIQLDRQKHNPVLAAKEAAQDIIDITSKEVIGMLLEESKDTIDEKINNSDDAEKADEADAKNDKEQTDKVAAETEELLSNYKAKQEEMLKKLQKQAQISNMLMDDLKGIFLDLRY
ncbi:hypothetical protein R2R35_13230 [Anaerocolumna sp. AGMB13020]|uniref:hypothetical protein n=1 Tax=Anaerocolumna sp. AGMB13020 TaxID=3081750 RepID=UPI0029536BE8|nr:hypothetical protein [Anaerocolumna sp. AGMB13020]WOO34764.1 hypothetical protein R2R35_13230 [Anaerocolumna sp. AGMB13020]